MTVPLVRLNNGVDIPQLGFGLYKVPPADAEAVLSVAFKAGYRHLDTASLYQNEAAVGAAVAASDLDRDDLFITTKIGNGDHGRDKTLAAFDASMAKLQLDVLDLLLIHWPMPSQDLYVETWQAMISLAEQGRVRAIGVSNFQQPQLERLLAETSVVPAVNQIELHPMLPQMDLRIFHAEHGIATEAWSPLARGGALLSNPVIVGIADRLGKTPAQVVLRWHLELANIVIPKSVTTARITSNFDVFDFRLDEGDQIAIASLDSNHRVGRNPADV